MAKILATSRPSAVVEVGNRNAGCRDFMSVLLDAKF
jgi:hypothetical protein